jgi:ribokinase
MGDRPRDFGDGNQAVAAARLGERTWLVGCIGDDDFGREAPADLRQAGVDTSLLAIGRAPTGVAAVMVDAEGENAIAVASGANQEFDPDMVQAAIASIPSAEAVVLACLEVPDGPCSPQPCGVGRSCSTRPCPPAPAGAPGALRGLDPEPP